MEWNEKKKVKHGKLSDDQNMIDRKTKNYEYENIDQPSSSQHVKGQIDKLIHFEDIE